MFGSDIDVERIFDITAIGTIILNVLLVAAVFVLQLGYNLNPFDVADAVMQPGWDFQGVCAGVRGFNAGNSLYGDYGVALYVWPPISLVISEITCAPTYIIPPKVVYVVLWIGALFGTYVLLTKADQSPDKLLLVTILASGYVAAYANFHTGNFGLIMLLLLSCLYHFAMKEEFVKSAPLVVAVSLLKIYPLVMGGLYVFIKKSMTCRAKVLFAFTASVITALLSQVLLLPEMTRQFSLLVSGQLYPDRFDVGLFDIGGLGRSSTYKFIHEILAIPVRIGFYDSNFHEMLVFLSFGLVGFVLFASLVWFRTRDSISSVDVLSLGIITILLIYPRLTTYGFALALIPTYILLRNQRRETQLVGLTVVSIIPIVLFRIIWPLSELVINVYLQPGLVYYIFEMIALVSAGGQLLGLLLFYLLILYTEGLGQSSRSVGSEGING